MSVFCPSLRSSIRCTSRPNTSSLPRSLNPSTHSITLSFLQLISRRARLLTRSAPCPFPSLPVKGHGAEPRLVYFWMDKALNNLPPTPPHRRSHTRTHKAPSCWFKTNAEALFHSKETGEEDETGQNVDELRKNKWS